MNKMDKTEEEGYRVFGNTRDTYRAVKVIDIANELIEINNEYSLPFSAKNTRMVFTLGSLQYIASWAREEIEKHKKQWKKPENE